MSGKIVLEVCANSVESSLAAQKGGADRVELCDNLYEGGTTPSYGTIELAREELHIDLNVLIRPRGGDFLYSKQEYEIIKKDILIAKKIGVDGVVIGILNTDGSIDKKRTKNLVELARPMSVTFHRAFDVSKDPFQSLEDIIDCGCNRILSSGQQNKAFDGKILLAELITKANNRIIVMPGSGINEANIKEILHKTNAQEFHASLKEPTESKMHYRKTGVNMNGLAQIPEFESSVTDIERVKNIIHILKK